jgi:flagellar biosynthesis protein FlhG
LPAFDLDCNPKQFNLKDGARVINNGIPEDLESDVANPFAQLAVPTHRRIKQIWAVGGGKGGVGKSLLASSLAIALARLGNHVIAIDLDLGGSNLHTTLGVDLPRQTLSDFFSSEEFKLENTIVPSGVPHLELISGAQDSVSISNISQRQKIRLMQKMNELDADYLVLDLGAGTSFNTIDFFLLADIQMLAILPEPTSIENAYRFIKTAYFKKLLHSRYLKDTRSLIEMAMDRNNKLGIHSPSDLFREVNKMSPESGMLLKREIEKFKPKIVINQARTQVDIDIGFSVKTICKKYFGIDADYVGSLDHDSSVWQAVRRKRPLMIEFPNSRLVSNIERITHYLTKRCMNEKNDLF